MNHPLPRRPTTLLLCALFLCAVFSGCAKQEAGLQGGALFSWKQSAVLTESETLFSLMREVGLETLYQRFPDSLPDEEIDRFMKSAADCGVAVYLLAGEPEWALDVSGKPLCDAVERAVAINAGLDGRRLQGLVLDVEPYLLDQWDETSAPVILDGFLQGARSAYARASAAGLTLILCIPYYYDTLELTPQLTDLIQSCCDGVAVMNYYRGKEAEHIETEVRLAAQYGKRLIQIYELQQPGIHGLTDQNTYYHLGLAAVEENFRALELACPELPLTAALHDFEALKAVMAHE